MTSVTVDIVVDACGLLLDYDSTTYYTDTILDRALLCWTTLFPKVLKSGRPCNAESTDHNNPQTEPRPNKKKSLNPKP